MQHHHQREDHSDSGEEEKDGVFNHARFNSERSEESTHASRKGPVEHGGVAIIRTVFAVPALIPRCARNESISDPSPGDKKRDDDDIHERERQKHLPARAHQDVVLQPWNRPADPHKNEKKKAHLDEEGHRRQEETEECRRLVVPGDVPSAEKRAVMRAETVATAMYSA